MGISLAIPCFNASATISSVVAGILGQRLPPDEIILIDDGSTDATLEKLDSFVSLSKTIHVVSNITNEGLGYTRNLALSAASGDIIAFLDADCCPKPQWLSELYETYSKIKSEYPDLVIVTGNIRERHRLSVVERWRKFHLRQPNDPIPGFARLFLGANFIADRKLLGKIGGFSDLCRSNYEDMELCIRIRHHGLRIYHCPSAEVIHEKRGSMLATLLNYLDWHYPEYLERIQPKRADGTVFPPKIRTVLFSPFLEDIDQHRYDLAVMSLFLPFVPIVYRIIPTKGRKTRARRIENSPRR